MTKTKRSKELESAIKALKEFKDKGGLRGLIRHDNPYNRISIPTTSASVSPSVWSSEYDPYANRRTADPQPDDIIESTSQALDLIIEVVSASHTTILKNVAEMKNSIEHYENEKDRIEKDLKIAATNIEDNKSKIIEILAIFVGLFTFVSLNFQLLKEVSTFESLLVSVGLVLISGGVIILFA